jgi:periplasmic divalent cation tolerance protein
MTDESSETHPANVPTAGIVMLMTAVASQEEADRIARALVQEGVAACCQSFSITSTYVWKGVLCREPEVLLLVKSAAGARAVTRIKELHSYELPEIIVIPVLGGYEPYLAWVRDGSVGS